MVDAARLEEDDTLQMATTTQSSFSGGGASDRENVRVAVRVRPVNEKEVRTQMNPEYIILCQITALGPVLAGIRVEPNP